VWHAAKTNNVQARTPWFQSDQGMSALAQTGLALLGACFQGSSSGTAKGVRALTAVARATNGSFGLKNQWDDSTESKLCNAEKIGLAGYDLYELFQNENESKSQEEQRKLASVKRLLCVCRFVLPLIEGVASCFVASLGNEKGKFAASIRSVATVIGSCCRVLEMLITSKAGSVKQKLMTGLLLANTGMWVKLMFESDGGGPGGGPNLGGATAWRYSAMSRRQPEVRRSVDPWNRPSVYQAQRSPGVAWRPYGNYRAYGILHWGGFDREIVRELHREQTRAAMGEQRTLHGDLRSAARADGAGLEHVEFYGGRRERVLDDDYVNSSYNEANNPVRTADDARNLMNRNTKAITANKNVLATLDGGSEICPICMSEWEDGEKARQTNCDHFYHEDCLLSALERKNTCPICRKKFS